LTGKNRILRRSQRAKASEYARIANCTISPAQANEMYGKLPTGPRVEQQYFAIYVTFYVRIEEARTGPFLRFSNGRAMPTPRDVRVPTVARSTWFSRRKPVAIFDAAACDA
jgi:hypothetical protein